MNWYYILLQAIRIIVFVLLFVVPFGYCLFKGNFKKGFWFTWIVWGIVVFIYGVFVPGIANLTAKVTGKPVDYDGFGFILGFIGGWSPCLIFASIGEFFHNVFMNIFVRK